MSGAHNRWNTTPLPLWVHDFLSGTAELSDAAVGRYIRLLCYQWTKGSVPSDPGYTAELHLFAPAEKSEGSYESRVARADKVLAMYFQVAGERAKNQRLERDRSQVKNRSKQAKKAAEERWAKDKREKELHADAYASNGQAVAKPPTPTPTPTPGEDTPPPEPEEGLTTKSSSSPRCPHQEIIEAYHEALPNLPRVESWEGERPGFLRARWRERQERQDVGWWREYFEHVSKSDFLMGRVEGRNGSFTCNLEWLIRPRNFQNVLEGKYHDNRRGVFGSGRYRRLN